jgi:hypothetical protein
MTGCSFDSMAQCEAMRHGIGGDCFHDPFLKDNNNANAYEPKHPDLRLERFSGARHH